MTQYLLALAPKHDFLHVVDRVIEDCARDHARLLAIFVVETMNQLGLPHLLTDQGLLGLGQTREVTDQVQHQTLETATRRLDHFEQMAAREGVDCTTDLLEGELIDVILKFVEVQPVDRIYVGGKTHSRLGQLIYGSEIEELIDRVPCEVMVIRQEH